MQSLRVQVSALSNSKGKALDSKPFLQVQRFQESQNSRSSGGINQIAPSQMSWSHYFPTRSLALAQMTCLAWEYNLIGAQSTPMIILDLSFPALPLQVLKPSSYAIRRSSGFHTWLSVIATQFHCQSYYTPIFLKCLIHLTSQYIPFHQHTICIHQG